MTRYAIRLRPHPFVSLQPNKTVLPQGVLPPPPPRNAPANPAAAPPAVRLPLGACFNCGKTGQFARDSPTLDLARKSPVLSEPENVKTTAEDVVECIAETSLGSASVSIVSW